MPGVFVCPFHEQFLFFTDAPQHPSGKFSFIPAEQSNIIGHYDSPGFSEKKPQLVQLARSYHELLNSRYQFDITFGQLSHYYHWLASHSNLIRRKRVDHQAVDEKFIAYWSRECLLLMDVSLIPVSSWLTTLFRKHRKAAHPLYHLLIWQALGEYHPVIALEMIASLPKARVSSLNESVKPDLGKRVAVPSVKNKSLPASCGFFNRRSYGRHIKMASAYRSVAE